ncbi:MAG: kinase [Proteobacteria bacterium]|nr:kinase [Pseudomonadota bacterium]
MSIVRLMAKDGTFVEFEDKIIGQGGMKDVYFSPDRSYVVAFFRDPSAMDVNSRDRLENLVGRYRDGIFCQAGGEYWSDLYCWPTKIVEYNGLVGVVCPTYPDKFFFSHGSINNDMLAIKGKEKIGKWFVENRHFLNPIERGNWGSYIRVSLIISRAVRRLHLAGLAHSDLSYRNVLVDPKNMSACIIDIDGLVVPDRYPPDVLGTPGFIAPEVLSTMHLDFKDPNRKLPNRLTDCHALAVLIYTYLLYRHPLDGRMSCDAQDPNRDEILRFGEKALFIEHPKDRRNRPDRLWLEKNYPPMKLKSRLPWADPDALPYTVLGPHLGTLVKRAFIDGLHNPAQRPSANEWETALVKTWDCVLRCASPGCEQGFFVYDNSLKPRCPFCGTAYGHSVPVLDFYTNRRKGKYTPDNHRLVAFDGQGLHHWHADAQCFPNERLDPSRNARLAYFTFHQGMWLLVNEGLTDLMEVQTKKEYPPGKFVVLKSGLQLLLKKGDGGRVVNVQITG